MDTMLDTPIPRSAALRLLGTALLVAVVRSRDLLAMPRRGFKHPAPRPGITAANVLPEAKLAGKKKRVKDSFAAVRSRPEIFDGVLCPCHCEGEHRSLLVCFETDQPMGCLACQEAALFVEKRAAKGESLDQIRKAVDEEWG